MEDYGIGFFAKWGDGGIDLSPIADLMKSEVFALAKELEIVNSIQIAAPTDGLWADGRSDQDQIGASYDELEWAMMYKEDGTDLSERQKVVLDIYKQRRSANLHKMVPVPVCLISNDLK